jgi:hypothetical protein
MDLTTQKKYRVYIEESYDHETEEGKTFEKWRYQELRGKYGTVYPYSHDYLGVQVKAGKIGNKTRRQHPDWPVIQDCDDLIVFKVKNSELGEAAKIIQARVRRYLTEDQKRLLAEKGVQFLFKPGYKAEETPIKATKTANNAPQNLQSSVSC